MIEKIFLPNPVNPEVSCLGDRWFFEKKFWKLAVMLGYDGFSDVLTTRGLSFLCMLKRNIEKVENIAKQLDILGIKYKKEWSQARWNYILVISGRKSNLELIDKLYKKYYNKTLKEIKKNKDNFIKIKSDYLTREYFEEVYGDSEDRDKYLEESKF